MQPSTRTRRRRPDRGEHLGKPHGLLAPRVQAVGPEHFGIVAIDPAKARSSWLLADFYGRVLIPLTPVEHTARDSTPPSTTSSGPSPSMTSATRSSPSSRPARIIAR